MTFDEFFENQKRFANLSTNEQVCRIAWYIHRILDLDRFAPKLVVEQYRQVHLNAPQVGVYLSRLVERKPPLILADKRGYYLEGRERKRLDDLLATPKSTAVVSELMRSLTNSITEGAEKVFFDEAVRCYEVTAFRAAIVMTWNLAYNHLRNWILNDQDRLACFNEGAIKRFQKRPKTLVSQEEDFDDYKESEFIDACVSGKVIGKNLEITLREKLSRRNMAAHPSKITIYQAQADDVITDLVKNVILAL